MTEPAVTQTQAATCTVDGCNAPAVALYQWDWGEKGACCDQHALILRQRAEHLQRTVHITPIGAGAVSVPVTRDERTALIAAKLSAEAECEQLKANGATLYQSNTQLQDECRRLGARNQQLTTELADAKAALTQAEKDRDQNLADKNQAITDLQRAQLLIAKPAPADSPHAS